MVSLNNPFVDAVVDPVELLYTSPSSTRSHQFSTYEKLHTHLSGPDDTDYTCLTISICQRHSWAPLQTTKEMLQCIISRYDIHPAIWDLSSYFYPRCRDSEAAFCMPYTQLISDSRVEILYTVRYPEFKVSDNTWVIRQTGIYHRFESTTRQSLYVLLNPMPNSKAYQQAKDFLLQNSYNEVYSKPFWLHLGLLSTYFPSWRLYVAAQEREVLKIRNRTIATCFDRPPEVGYDNLSALVSLDNSFLQIPTILTHATDVLDELLALIHHPQSWSPLLPADTTKKLAAQLKGHRLQCAAYSRTATYLQHRAQTTAQLLAQALSFHDQAIAKEQNGTMLRLNKSVVSITTVTLLYLPASFVSTFFGMSFFSMDTDNSRIVATSMIWIYVVAAVLLTAATFATYFWLLLHDAKRPQSHSSEDCRILLGLWKGVWQVASQVASRKRVGQPKKELAFTSV